MPNGSSHICLFAVKMNMQKFAFNTFSRLAKDANTNYAFEFSILQRCCNVVGKNGIKNVQGELENKGQ